MNNIINATAAGSTAEFRQGASQNKTSGSQAGDMHSWYEAMAKAWGTALDNQAGRIASLSDAIGVERQSDPSVMISLTSESMRMQFLSQNASTSMSSVGQALETLARK
jgi:hypothetical protein